MAINNFHFKLDIEREDHIPKFKLKQYDTAIFYATLYRKGIPYHFENEKIKMFVKKNDGTIVYQEDEIVIQDDEIKINVKNQALTASGLTYAELELKSSTGQVTTATFIFEVREKVGSDKAIESITDISTLEKVDKYVEEAKKELDKFKNTLTPLQDLVANKDKLEGQNTEAKVNIKELEKVLEDANNIVSDEGKKVTGNNVVSEGVTNGYVQDIKINGKTLVNEILSRANFNGSDKTVYTNIKLQKGKLYANKTYTYIPLGVPSKCNSMYLGTSDSTMVAIRNAPVKPTTFILPRDALENELLPHFYGADFTLDDFINTKLLILEGDHTQSPPSYFEGIKSVGDGIDSIEVNSCNLNAFDEDLLSSRLEDDGYYHFRASGNTRCTVFMGFVDSKAQQITSMTPNLVTDLSEVNLEGCRFLIGLNGDKNDDKVLIPIGHIGYLNTTFFKGCEFIIVDNNHVKVRNIELSYGKTSSSYIPREQSKRNVLYYDPSTKSWKKPILREWDTTERHADGKYYYHRRSGETLVKGVPEWSTADPAMQISGYFTARLNIQGYIPEMGVDSVIADKYINNISRKFIGEGIYNQDSYNGYNTIALRLLSSKGADIYNFKDYLNRFPFTLVYKLAKEEIYECLDISVRSFRHETMLSVDGGAIDPGVEYCLPASFVSADNSLSAKLENTDSELIKLMFDYLAHDHDSRYYTQNQSSSMYFRKDLGIVSDFNQARQEGKYNVGSSTGLPNAPFTGGIYGVLEVLTLNEEILQRFTSIDGKIYTRFYNYQLVWRSWEEITRTSDIRSSYGTSGYQLYPNGFTIQFGRCRTNNGVAPITFPLSFISADDIYLSGSSLDPSAQAVGFRSLTTNNCEVTCSWTSNPIDVRWIAIGKVRG